MKAAVWENGFEDKVDPYVTAFLEARFRSFDVDFLYALDHRDKQDIIDNIRDASVVVGKLNLLDPVQVRKLTSMLGRGIYGKVFGDWLHSFIFLSSFPKEDAEQVAEACRTEWSEDVATPRNGLTAILARCKVQFIDVNGDHYAGYEIKSTGSDRDFKVEEIKYS